MHPEGWDTVSRCGQPKAVKPRSYNSGILLQCSTVLLVLGSIRSASIAQTPPSNLAAAPRGARGHPPADRLAARAGARDPAAPGEPTPPARSVTGTRVARIPRTAAAAVARAVCRRPRRGGLVARRQRQVACPGLRGVRGQAAADGRGGASRGGRRSVSASRSTRCRRPLGSSGCAAILFLLEQREGLPTAQMSKRPPT